MYDSCIIEYLGDTLFFLNNFFYKYAKKLYHYSMKGEIFSFSIINCMTHLWKNYMNIFNSRQSTL